MRIPTTQELADQHLSSLEGAVAQTSPLADKAFLRVVAAILAMAHTGLYKLAVERSMQNLALTATGDDLDLIGGEISVTRKPAESARLLITIPATTGVTIPLTAAFIGDANGLRYAAAGSVTAAAGSATLSVTAEAEGVAGNLQVTDTLSIISPLPSVASSAVVSGVENVGAEAETDDAYRARILFALRSTKGGGNATDYKTWAEEVAGVTRAFPCAGRPAGAGTAYPGDRTVYVQADATLNADGIPSAGLLDEVRAAINADPVTGKSRPGLGLIDDTVYVEPITRTTVNVTITNLATPAGTEASVRADIATALSLFFAQFAPFTDGIDAPTDRADRITTPALSTALQEVLDATGSSAAGVSLAVGGVTYGAYQLAAGELVKRGVVTYAVL